MRMLFTSTAGLGDFHPVVALACAARAASHDVAYATTDDRRAVVERLGFAFFRAGTNMTEIGALMRGRYPDVPMPSVDVEGRKRLTRLLMGNVYVEAMLPGLLDGCQSWRPDVIVRANLAYGGWLAAEECEIPHVTVEAFSSGEPAWERENMGPELSAWRKRRGLPPDPALVTLHRYLTLVPFPAPLRHPDSPFGPTARRIKPLIFSDSTDADLPDWMDALAGAPVVHVSLGTLSNRPDVLRAIIDGLAGEPLTVVLATGRVQHVDLSQMPPNFRAAAYISHAQLLPRCDAIITHAGAGTLIASVNAGLPMVLVPLSGDQPANAERAAAAGAGIVLDHASLTPASVRDATRSVLTDPSYRRAVRALRDEIEALPSHADAVRWIAQIAETKAPLPVLG
jgi:MGT family glycosyltransferase